MKKFGFYIGFLFCSLFAFSQTLLNESFTVVPKDIYIGDIIEIQYTFSTNINLLEEKVLDLEFPKTSQYDILSANLTENNENYILKISCIPWEVGSLELPKIDLSNYSKNLPTSFEIDIPLITVQSIVERTQKKELRPIMPPQLIPGTTWIIYFFIIILFLLLVTFLYFLFHSKKFFSNLNNFSINMKYKRNLKKTIKRIKKLNKKSAKYSDKDFSKEISTITRDFLSTRFKQNFHSVVSSKISEEINNIFQDLLPEEIIKNVESISTILCRCDYVRFSKNINSDAELSFVERSSISDSLIENFSVIANQRSIEC